MPAPIELTFRSRLRASAEKVWGWVVSVEGISAEMRPFFRMTVPPGVRTITDIAWRPGQPLFRSRVFLFGVLPIGHSDLTLLELMPGRGFVEQSPMGSMRLWRHERRIEPLAGANEGVILTDRLTFDPKWARGLVAWYIDKTFQHRHAVLRRAFDGDA